MGFRLSHPLVHQIGARWDVPHGVTSCIVLPATARFLHARSSEAQVKIGCAMGSESDEGAATAIETFLDTLIIPRRILDTRAKREEIPAVAEAVSKELGYLGVPDADITTPAALTDLLESVW